MNARERKKVFMDVIRSAGLDKEAIKIFQRLKVPPVDIIISQLGLDSTSPAEAVKHYAKFLLEHIKDPVQYLQDVQTYAKRYMQLGLKPIPLYPGTKRPVGNDWRNGYLNIGPDDIPLIWNSIYNIGLLTGPPSNLLTLDFESEAAFNAFIDVLNNHPDFERMNLLEKLGPTPIDRTGRGVHMHFIVDDPGNMDRLANINSLSKRFFKDFEIRWKEGQVAAPPSLHPAGVFYTPISIAEGSEKLTLDFLNLEPKKIKVADVARILDAFHKTGRLNIERFKLNEFTELLAYLLNVEEKFKSSTSWGVATIDFTTQIDDKKEAALLNALQKIWPEPGAGRWAASCAISALLGILGVPKETTKRLIEHLIRSLQPDTPERWIRDLAHVYPEATYRDLERYQSHLEEAKRTGKPIPKLPVAYKSILLMNTPFTEEQIDEVRREVERILGVRVADRLGLAKKQQLSKERNVDQLIQPWLLPDELQAGVAKTEIEEANDTLIRKIHIPIIKYIGNSVRFLVKTIQMPITENGDINEQYEPSYSYSLGHSLTTKPIIIKKLAYIGDDVFVHLNVGGFDIEGPVELVVAELQRKKILIPNKGAWLGAYLSFLAKREKGEFFTRLGIHKSKDGLFTWVGHDHEKFYPIGPMRVELAKALEKYVQNSESSLYDKFINAIISYKKYVNAEAYWLGMSFMFIGPFISAARHVFKLAPILLFHNPLPGSGKTNLAKFITQVAHGIKPFDKDLLDSSFRFLETFDSLMGVIMFDEIGTIKPEVLDALIAAVTGSGSSARGRGINTMKTYDPVASALFTSNKNGWEISQASRWLDRLVQVEVSPNLDFAAEYLLEIDNPFALSAVNDSERVTVAHYFLPELVRLVNELGGEAWLHKRFQAWFKVGVERKLKGEGGRRTVHKFATFMVGLELMGKFLRSKGHKIDVTEGGRVIFQHFAREAIEIPRPLENLIYLLTKVKSKTGEYLIDYTFLEKRNAHAITTDILNLIIDEARRAEREVPSTLSTIAAIIASLKKYGSHNELYPQSGVKVHGKNRKAVLIPRQLVHDVLGYLVIEAATEDEEDEINHQLLDEIVNVLSMQPATFDELKQMTAISESKLVNALKELEKLGIIWAQDGKYKLINRNKAVEMGFSIVEVIEK